MSVPAPPDNAISATFANRVDEIGRAVELVCGFGERHRLGPRVIHDFCVAFDEILSNIVKFAYRDRARHEISVRLEISDGNLVAEIADDGEPFDPLAAPPPRLQGRADERPIGGLGIYFVRSLMDEVRYARHDNRNVLMMRKRVGAAGAAP